MFCISSPNCRVFAHVVHTLAKIGDEVLFEPRPASLVLKTKNMAESSYAEIEFHANFFSTFSFNPTVYQENTTNFKIAMRSLVTVVKSAHSFDKNVETCMLRYEQGKLQLIVTINYSKGTTKEYIIPHVEYESFEANFSKSDANNYILSDACTLISATNQFKSGEDEITLSSGKENSVLENHLQNAKDCKTTVKTTVRVDHQYLEEYSIRFPTQITFCLKEFKALLALSESVRLPIAFHFDTPGKPLILEVGEQNVFRINVLISTLQALQGNQQQTSQNLPESSATPSTNHARTDDNPQETERVTVTKNIPNHAKNGTQYSNQTAQRNDNKSDKRHVNSQSLASSRIPESSQRGSENGGHTNTPSENNRTQNHIPVNVSKSKNSQSNSLRNYSQREEQNNLESLILNDVLEADKNDCPSSQTNHEPSSNPRTEKASVLSNNSPLSRRSENVEINNHFDVDAFVADNEHVDNLDAHSSAHVSNAKLTPDYRDSVSQRVYLTLFKQWFNSLESHRKKNRPKILVYNSDDLSDSD